VSFNIDEIPRYGNYKKNQFALEKGNNRNVKKKLENSFLVQFCELL
jgi:hypothetical protein